ncbi:TnsA-like heteromeric transposase endonuclease subunit [Streptomyces anulatus]|uniref:TnsA-like heteromeric transposase endonuclease subunit n=1 Tax=Streptomyces anulatus TaxID=1892 RepID=UPI002E31B97B|nr:TnsA-like heteromeric transposase endonuclease subunit [Streptomyces anulatus]
MTVGFEELPPVSAFPVIPGRRWGPGLWWSATTGRHVAAGSNAMRTQLMVLDRDPDVTGLAGRPVRVLWREERGRVRSWVPGCSPGTATALESAGRLPQPHGRGGDRAVKAAEAVSAACEEIGWAYRRLAPLDDVLAANLKWLVELPPPGRKPPRRPAVVEAFARPRPLIEGVEAAGDPIEVPAGGLPRPASAGG